MSALSTAPCLGAFERQHDDELLAVQRLVRERLQRRRQLLHALLVAGDDDDVAHFLPAQVRLAAGGRFVVALAPVDFLVASQDGVAADDVDAGVDGAPGPVDVEADEHDRQGQRQEERPPDQGADKEEGAGAGKDVQGALNQVVAQGVRRAPPRRCARPGDGDRSPAGLVAERRPAPRSGSGNVSSPTSTSDVRGRRSPAMIELVMLSMAPAADAGRQKRVAGGRREASLPLSVPWLDSLPFCFTASCGQTTGKEKRSSRCGPTFRTPTRLADGLGLKGCPSR